MAKLYSKYGDNGFTYTKSNPKIPKNDKMIHLLGDIDELNSSIGYLSSLLPHDEMSLEIKTFLSKIMSVLFSVGAYIGYNDELSDKSLDEFTNLLESKIDFYESFNGQISGFILPTGSGSAAYTHVCRTVCRRVERHLYDVEKADTNKSVLRFFNRLSDYLFSMARTCNRVTGGKEVLWEKVI